MRRLAASLALLLLVESLLCGFGTLRAQAAGVERPAAGREAAAAHHAEAEPHGHHHSADAAVPPPSGSHDRHGPAGQPTACEHHCDAATQALAPATPDPGGPGLVAILFSASPSAREAAPRLAARERVARQPPRAPDLVLQNLTLLI